MGITDGNPYARFLAMGQEQAADAGPAGDSQQAGLGAAPVRMRIGKVVSTVPLKVSVAGLVQPPKALRINERLVKRAKWKVKVTSPNSDYRALSGSVIGAVHSGDTTIDEAVVEQLEIDLAAEDLVLLLTEDDQVFYLIMKVVDAI